jgi:hypothetical protein
MVYLTTLSVAGLCSVEIKDDRLVMNWIGFDKKNRGLIEKLSQYFIEETEKNNENSSMDGVSAEVRKENLANMSRELPQRQPAQPGKYRWKGTVMWLPR